MQRNPWLRLGVPARLGYGWEMCIALERARFPPTAPLDWAETRRYTGDMTKTTETTTRPMSAGLAAIVKAVSEGWIPLEHKTWPPVSEPGRPEPVYTDEDF